MRISAYPLTDADEAAALVLENVHVLGAEEVSIADSVGRVLAEDVIAPGPLPAFPSSAVDGYAIRAADAGKTLRVLGESAAGRPFDEAVAPGTAAPLGSVTVPVIEAVTSWLQAQGSIPVVARYMVSNTSRKQQNALDGRLITALLEREQRTMGLCYIAECRWSSRKKCSRHQDF